jgi:NAD(P)-dependent dehydrogenase (short-subunit alcohol dehydrogenase family)
VMAMPHLRTDEGFEMQIGTNHLGHFALTGLLIERVMATAASRVVVVASNAHKFGKMDFDDLLWEKSYSAWAAYGRSKLANLLFAYELQRRLERAGSSTIVTAAHPGGARTGLGTPSHGFAGKVATILRPAIMLAMQPARMGALPTLRAACDPDARGGDYYGPDRLAEQRGHPVKVESNPRSRNTGDAERLWAASERLTGITFDLGASH